MKARPSDIERALKSPPEGVAAFLFFGPDQGLVHERAEAAAKSVVPDPSDAFRVSELDEATLLADPARLMDEAAAISMLGGRRVVRVRGAGNGLSAAFETLLADVKGDALVVVEAGDLAKSSSLRRLFEEADNAMAVACYPDTVRDLPDVVRAALKAEGLSIAGDALDDAVARLGADRGVTRRELEKLALYAHGQQRVTRDDVRAAMGDAAEIRSEEVCDAAGGGDFAALDRALERLWSEETSPVQVVRAAIGHFQRLLTAKEMAARGGGLDSAMRAFRPPIHFSRTAAFKNQAQRWSEDKLLDALDLLLDTEALCKTTAVPAEAATARALLNVAAMARAR
jgi:DNA polymerase III subunit delta